MIHHAPKSASGRRAFQSVLLGYRDKSTGILRSPEFASLRPRLYRVSIFPFGPDRPRTGRARRWSENKSPNPNDGLTHVSIVTTLNPHASMLHFVSELKGWGQKAIWAQSGREVTPDLEV